MGKREQFNIDILPISQRAKSVLINIDIADWEDLKMLNKHVLSKLRQCGSKTTKEIMNLMQSKDLKPYDNLQIVHYLDLLTWEGRYRFQQIENHREFCENEYFKRKLIHKLENCIIDIKELIHYEPLKDDINWLK